MSKQAPASEDEYEFIPEKSSLDDSPDPPQVNGGQ